MKNLTQLLLDCPQYLDHEWQQLHKDLFVKEHMEKLAKTLLHLLLSGTNDKRPLPHFHVECTPSISIAFHHFAHVMLELQRNSFSLTEQGTRLLCKALQSAGCQNILILLGQRHTPASITDHRAIPPTTQELMSSAFEEAKQQLSVAARAWTKHVGRSEDQFWGQVKGSAQTKNKTAHQIVLSILENTTWWNVFYHYKHQYVYEARVKSGHGVRWGNKGKEFIGFLEPFLEEEKNGNNF